MKRSIHIVILLLFLVEICSGVYADEPPPQRPKQADRKFIFAHYMPWFEAKPVSPNWGWHWTMNAFDPDQISDGKRKIASHYYPLIGPYDSGDPHVLEYHLLLMKLAGIDGVIVDWYGLEEFRDYPILHRNTERLFEQCGRLGVHFIICYEDQTVSALVTAGRLKAEDRIKHVTRELEWTAKHWFASKTYFKIERQPVLLSFGHEGLTDQEWAQSLTGVSPSPAYFSEHHRRPCAKGAFDWPIPKEGLRAVERFRKDSAEWSASIPVVFPRFVDIYVEAKVHESWGRIEDGQGEVFHESLKQAMAGSSSIIQIATWNDWGEGTSIEPSVEFKYRDLEAIQRYRGNHLDKKTPLTPADLELPGQLLELRRRNDGNSEVTQNLDAISIQIASGRTAFARRLMEAAGK